MFHHAHPIDRQRLPAVPAALVIGYAAGTLTGIAVTRRWHSRHLASAMAEAAAWRSDAFRDPLTGLPNRRAALAEVTRRLDGGRPFLLALLDLDQFKSVNDIYGHPTGDDLLTIVAARLSVATAPEGFAARLGGDEFLLLLPDLGGDPASVTAPVLTTLAHPVRIGAATLRPRACIGVTTTAGGAPGWRHLLSRADRALYRAKASGDGVAVYDARLDAPTVDDDSRRPRVRRRDHHQRRPASGCAAEPGA
ncbi:MAG: GGDEF domain-containing protein [Micromonosporaceae bacterium]|nr:GGDEF domain-containing protein [Micromonosporaceae bacterium]